MSSDTFADLQKVFFAAFIQGLGYNLNQPAQVVQPSPPIIGDDEDDNDKILWSYFNTLPTSSLTRNTTLASGTQFLSTYSAIMSSLQSPPNKFKEEIGEYCFDAFSNAVENGNAEATPRGYRDWAFLTNKCSSHANSGASAYAAMLLDPIFAGQNNVLPYKPVGRKSVDFFPDYNTMMKQLKKAPSREFTTDLSIKDTSYTKTWNGGAQSAVFGLWSNSYSNTEISQKFASSSVHLEASFKNLLPFSANPGDWYNSATLGIAYSEAGTPPWSPNGLKTWKNTFSASGDMQRFTTLLLIANQMKLVYSTAATFSTTEQKEIIKNSRSGLWPFYHKSSENVSETSVNFDTSGRLMVTVTTEKNVPTIVGAIIEPVDKYLGHLRDASQLELRRLIPRG
ncbi:MULTISPECIES: hypothetical protein [Pectobacterium]|uniref:Uncharacterized protein n=1 Tax=Pectobacterium carotovorum subsp. carotovorum (strain PC1) TaxID=561230 RepID=C6DJM7_PECCP|nr:hypothetical protein [Pectobacterium carotovorum]ACT11440.1 hypothetical protein PC1_0383 [Pectobacterium carotovorum subsp. carotovorum PC1]